MGLIDADTIKQRIIAFCTGCSTTYLTVENIVMLINQADTVDAVPVVRCGECRFSRGVRPDDGCYPDCIMCENEDMHATIPAPVYVTDFCSYGKRKVDENGRT